MKVSKSVMVYLKKIVDRSLPIFHTYGWKYAQVPDKKKLLDTLIELVSDINGEVEWCSSGRFLVMKTDTIVGVEVFLEIGESDWEFDTSNE